MRRAYNTPHGNNIHFDAREIRGTASVSLSLLCRRTCGEHVFLVGRSSVRLPVDEKTKTLFRAANISVVRGQAVQSVSNKKSA